MRRKNRQIKITLDIPEVFEDDEAFMMALRDRMDEDSCEWTVKVNDDGEEHKAEVSLVVLGDVSIEPEEEG